VNKIIIFLSIAGILVFSFSNVFGQELQLATFQETAQIIIDQQISKNVTASITLQSTSNQEMKIPSELEDRILNDEHVISVVITNEEKCITGVIGESCILINVKRDESWEGINEIQDETKKIGNSFIEEINEFFDTNAEFHSVFIHHKDETNVALGTSGVISGRNTVSSTYTMPSEDTKSMYEKLSAILLPKVIRDSGGFYDVAKKLSGEQNAKMSFTIIPNKGNALYLLKLSIDYPNQEFPLKNFRPLEFFKTDELKRSDYFSQGFYPLNSIFQVAIISDDDIVQLKPNLVESEIKNGVNIPVDVKQSGWIFVSEDQEQEEVVYLFGDKSSIKNDELEIVFTSFLDNNEVETSETDDSLIIVAIIVVAAIAASIFYLKGYKKKT